MVYPSIARHWPNRQNKIAEIKRQESSNPWQQPREIKSHVGCHSPFSHADSSLTPCWSGSWFILD